MVKQGETLMKYFMAILTCSATLLVFSIIGVLVGIPTAGIGFLFVQIFFWAFVMPKAWRWAMTTFDTTGDKPNSRSS